jgi:hypothetical protein
MVAVVGRIGGGRAADLDPVVVVTVEMRWSKCVGGEEVSLGVVTSAVSTSVSELFMLGISSNSVSMEPPWSVIIFLQSFA